MSTTADRLNPTHPDYDPELVKLRALAFQAWDDHQRDMKVDPEYRRAAKKVTKEK